MPPFSICLNPCNNDDDGNGDGGDDDVGRGDGDDVCGDDIDNCLNRRIDLEKTLHKKEKE